MENEFRDSNRKLYKELKLSHIQLSVFSIILILLILLSAFFSCAETALMAINRYRLRHKARMKRRYAMLILKLVKRPDRLLGMILIGNNFSNILASALATLIAIHFWGETGVVISTMLLTIVILIFAEVAPKTVAALYPEQISKLVIWPVYIMLTLFYPIVWVINVIANGILRLMRVNVFTQRIEPLSREELKSVVYETTGKIPVPYQNMLLGILDLNKISVDDVMIPRHEIIGIDIEESWEAIQQKIATCENDWLPVYRETINQVIGILHLRDLTHLMVTEKMLTKEMVQSLLHEPYFVPDSTPLNIQLLNFQRQRKRFALVVDEYGEIEGLITLGDILEEIVGEFMTTVSGDSKILQEQSDGSYLVDGSITIRNFNRMTTLQLPAKGPRTLNGLIVEYLEAIPHTGTCVLIEGYPIEIVDVKDNRVKVARVFSRLTND